MKWTRPGLAVLVLFLSACAVPYDETGSETEAPTVNIPDAVVAIAAPYQDLTTARLRSEDGCYWYLHAGPVETTPLPLRSVDGRQICSASRSVISG